MRRLPLLCVSALAAALLVFALVAKWPAALENGLTWVKSLHPGRSDSILVLLVADRSGIAAVRASLDPARILAETPDAIVLREGRVVATGPESVGEPLMEAGLADRPIELWSATPPARWDPEEKGEGEITLAALAEKSHLTPLEVVALLSGSVQ